MKRAIEIRTQADQLADRKPDVKPVAYVVVSDNSDGSLAGVEGMTHYKFIGPLQHLPLGRHGLVLAAHLQTEQSMHAAWRKRAEEAETRLAHDLAAIEAARKEEREACIEIISTYQVPVGNSSAGELAADWTIDALTEIRDAIRARGVKP